MQGSQGYVLTSFSDVNGQPTVMRQIFHDLDLQEAYNPRGYVTCSMLAENEVTEMLSALAGLQPDDGFRRLHERGDGLTYHCSFIDSNRAYRRQVHALILKHFEPHVKRILKSYRILNGNFYVKPPGHGEFVVHQNWPAVSHLDDTTVTIWCPLVDVVKENGAIQVVSGSHKLLPHVETLKTASYFKEFEKILIDDFLKPVPMKAGESIIFDDGLIHWSANNDSDEARIAIQILCIPTDSQPAYWYYDEAHPDRFELIEADTEFFLTNDIQDLRSRQQSWKSLGFAPNLNRRISEKEFRDLMAPRQLLT